MRERRDCRAISQNRRQKGKILAAENFAFLPNERATSKFKEQIFVYLLELL
jgi:hypothetical protein